MSKALSSLAAVMGVDPSGSDTPEPKPEAKTASSLASREDRLKALKAVETKLNKQFGVTSSLVRLGNKVGHVMPSISGDLPTFDWDVIGTGGIPKGRMIEFFGAESGGKTTLALHYVAKVQQSGGIAAYIDAEHALSPDYMAQLGVDVDNLQVAQPDSLEQSVETVEALVDSGAVDLIVVDSVAALTPAAELAGDSGDSHMGLQARLMGQAMRKLRGKCAVAGIPVIWINQIRTNLGQTYGNPEVTPGGKALKFFASLRVKVSRVGSDAGKIMSGNVQVGHKVKLNAVKNKVGTPARSTEIDLIYGKGFETENDLITYAVAVGAIDRSGAWYSVAGERLGQGLTNTISALKDRPELLEQVRGETERARAAQREAEAL